MDFAWAAFSGEAVTSINHVRLESQQNGARVFWGDRNTGGRWSYVDLEKILTIEFKASKRMDVPPRRHAFQKRDDHSYDLLAAEHPIYEMQQLWTLQSVIHRNAGPVVLTLLVPPSTVLQMHASQ